MGVSRRALLASALVALLLVTGCSSNADEAKEIPAGMSEAAYGLGAEVYEHLQGYIQGSSGYNETGMLITESCNDYSSDMDVENSEQDYRMMLMCTFASMNMSTYEESDESIDDARKYLDAVGCLLKTGEYSEYMSEILE